VQPVQKRDRRDNRVQPVWKRTSKGRDKGECNQCKRQE